MEKSQHYPPYLMKRETAAEYLDIGVDTFDIKIKPFLTPIKFGETSRGFRYLRCEIESLVDKMTSAMYVVSPEKGESLWLDCKKGNYPQELSNGEISSTSEKLSKQNLEERRKFKNQQDSPLTNSRKQKPISTKSPENTQMGMANSKRRKRLRMLQDVFSERPK